MKILIHLVLLFIFVSCQSLDKQLPPTRKPANYTIQNYPILEALDKSGAKLAPETKEWMKKWKGMDLEDSSQYALLELSGSTSINLKVQKIEKADPDGYKSRGTFVPRNSAGNPNLEVAYFNLSAILGQDHLFRPAVPYQLGSQASLIFKNLIEKAVIKGTNRQENRKRILAAIATGKPLNGCLKAKKLDSEKEFDALADSKALSNGAPQANHPIIKALQASNPQPRRGEVIKLINGYNGDLSVLAKEYSILMTLDSIFQQWDRYSGGNISIQKDENGNAHFYATDNGGADLSKTTNWAERNLSWFSRYDRETIKKLRELYGFLENPAANNYLGYQSAELFIVALGLYFELEPAIYVERLKRNLKLLFDRVEKSEARFGKNAYFD